MVQGNPTFHLLVVDGAILLGRRTQWCSTDFSPVL
ncbi:hypothetical protein T03_11526 [Trichinella britovi]|uniref:Uncharacterized protein n=1 Tax=Trichinella britovi TaxID=45882 RepID=A0A0V0Z3Q7_TRIBR|nr:hypothetical protein T03_11526 [Trichinella britovi]